MRAAIEYESKVKAGWIDCFKPERKQLYRTLLVMTLQMFQQLTGANYFFYVSTLSVQPHSIDAESDVSVHSTERPFSNLWAFRIRSSHKLSSVPSISAARLEECTSWKECVPHSVCSPYNLI